MKKKTKKRLIIIAAVFILFLIIAYFAVGSYFYNFALNAHDEKEFLSDNPHLQESETVEAEAAEQAAAADEAFQAAHPPTAWSVVSSDKRRLKLHADVYQNGEATHKWAVVVHGYTSRAAHMTRWIRNFYEKGYSVLAPDLRGHGKSEGDYIGMGWHDRLDILLWIDAVTKRDPEAEIALFGISMGGATVMMASGEELPANVKVIVEDCGYPSVGDIFTYQLDDLFGLPPFPVLNAANTMTKLRAGYGFHEASAVRQLKKSKTPILFIHGDADTFVPFGMLDEVYEAAPMEKEKLVIKGAGHGQAAMVDPDLYWGTIWGFVGRYI